MKEIQIIGTSHIARESVEAVRQKIEEVRPEIIALELDLARFEVLFKKQDIKIRMSDIRRFGVKGFLFNLVGAFIEKKLGEKVGVAPGSEMKAAVIAAKKNSARIVLIDQDITVTLKKLSKRITWKERGRLVGDIIKGLWSKKKVGIDLSKVPSNKLIKRMTNEVKKRYPSIYKTLIYERNHIMAQNLYNLKRLNPDTKILAIVGAGHVKEMNQLLKGKEDDDFRK